MGLSHGRGSTSRPTYASYPPEHRNPAVSYACRVAEQRETSSYRMQSSSDRKEQL